MTVETDRFKLKQASFTLHLYLYVNPIVHSNINQELEFQFIIIKGHVDAMFPFK